jgi:hypothetical protein
MAPPPDKEEKLTERELGMAEKLLGILERRREDGSYYFSDDDVQHFLPAVFLAASASPPGGELPGAVRELLGIFAANAGIDPEASTEAVQQAVERYYAAHPIHPELLSAFQAFVREELQAGGDDAVSRAFSGFLRADANAGVLGGGERPEGTTPGGPLARLAGVDDEDG